MNNPSVDLSRLFKFYDRSLSTDKCPNRHDVYKCKTYLHFQFRLGKVGVVGD